MKLTHRLSLILPSVRRKIASYSVFRAKKVLATIEEKFKAIEEEYLKEHKRRPNHPDTKILGAQYELIKELYAPEER